MCRPLKPKCTVPRDGANHTRLHNRWDGPISSRSGLRGCNVSRGVVPTTIIQGHFMWYCDIPFRQTRHSQITHTAAILIVVFLHSFCFTTGTFYIAIYFQVRFSQSRDMDSPIWRADVSSIVLGRGWNVPIRCGDGFSSLFIRVHAHLHSGCMVHGLLASQAEKHEQPKVDILRRFNHRCCGLRCVYQ